MLEAHRAGAEDGRVHRLEVLGDGKFELGLIEQDERGYLYVTQKAADRFQKLTRTTLESLLPIAESLASLLRR